MHKIPIQDLLVNVEKPSRYLGTEIHRVIKDPAAVALHMALAFPDLYDIGTSHFGIQILYHLLNQREDIFAERVFAPAKDMEKLLRQNKLSLCSLETQTPLSRFHIVGFSLLYELNFTNVLNMLALAGLPLYAVQRDHRHPFVIAGGPCISNPEPMAPFFDAMVFGDGEEALPRMTEIWMAWQKKSKDRQALLRRWARLECVYVPAFFRATYDVQGFQRLTPVYPDYTRVTRAVVGDLNAAFFPECPTIPFGKPIHDRLRLEISRGCSRGCRFCQAGMIYRPVRERSPKRLLDIADAALAATGYEDLSLLSLSTGDYTCLAPLMENLMQRCRSDRVAVSLPSIRAGTLTPALMALIKKVRKTGFTIAPEAGSQRLRDVINKNIRFEDIADTVRDAFALGWQVIKLYFMIGLPSETQADLDAIVEMVQALKQIKGPAKRRGKLNVSVTTFIPKAHTPFQWASQIDIDTSWSKIEYLKTRLRQPGLQVKWQHPQMSLLEGALARGDRRLARVIEQAWRLGCTFDGWSDQFDFGRWQQAFNETGISIDSFTTRQRTMEEPLPWEIIDSRVSQNFLQAQWEAAQRDETLDDCRHGKCYQCGVCDFKTLQPQRYVNSPQPMVREPDSRDAEPFGQLALVYEKRDQARFFGHLEVAGIFARALRRAGIPVVYSQGFHPMPRISFDDPIPLGMESVGERMRLKVAPHLTCQEVQAGLNDQLPQGLAVISCRKVVPGETKYRIPADHYHVVVDLAAGDLKLLERFNAVDKWPYQRISRKGRVDEIDLKQCIETLSSIDHKTLHLIILKQHPFTIRPADVLRSVLDLPDKALAEMRVIKLAPDQYR